MSWWRDRGVEPDDCYWIEQSIYGDQVRVFARLADGSHVPGLRTKDYTLTPSFRAPAVASKMIRQERKRQRRKEECKPVAGTTLRYCTFKEEQRWDGLSVSHTRGWDCE